MKKIMAMCALLMMSGVVEAAPDYTGEALKQTMCGRVGDLAKTINEGRRGGVTLDVHRLIVSKSTQASYLTPMIDLIYSLEPEDQEAYMLGWAACMDMLK